MTDAVRVTKRYMGSRKMRDLRAVTAHTAQVIADWEQLRLTTALGTVVKRESRIVLKQPVWMPGWLYRRLLRSMVVETRDATR